MTESILRLPAVEGHTHHGWLATIGLTRILAARFPNLTLRWDQYTPLLTGGPDSIQEAASIVYADTIEALDPGGVLPGCAAGWPTAGTKDQLARGITAQGGGPDWTGVLVSGSGLLHPLLRMHAAQTPRGVFMAMVRALTGRPDLIEAALTRLGLDTSYRAGLWLLRHDDEARPSASPGRDWLAVQALPWMPPVDIYGPDGAVMVTAPGWELDPSPVLTWTLWTDAMPVASIPATLAAGYLGDRDPVFAAHRPPPPSIDRYRPPYMVTRR